VYEFIREIDGRQERFRLRRRIGYRARFAGGGRNVKLVVPRDLNRWHTDYASVPAVFTWLVPRSGDHLPAALLHDALLEQQLTDPAPDISRDEADDVMRQAMGDLGTGVVRRWLVWTAVSMPTVLFGRVGNSRSWAFYHASVAWITILAIVGCGIFATVDVLDDFVPRLQKFPWELPWMRGGRFSADVWRGAAGAVFIPAALSAFWLRFWRAGIIAGIALAVLLHVTVAVLVLTVVYLGLEWLGQWLRGRVLLGVLVAAVLAGTALFTAAVFRWP
jgi:hypothetical protein